ncbi:MAG: hypothetical protein J1E38_00385 [Paramuribaculum sp.]|nr:hypothetical protein [Paramuribaculum sp.]
MEKHIRCIETPGFKVLWMPLMPFVDMLPEPIKNSPRSLERFAARILVEHEFKETVQLSRSASGRPYLSPAINCASAFCPPISISHGAGIIALAWCKTGDSIGIDVEGHRGQLLRVYPRFLRPEEYPDEITVDTLLPLWTMKEAAWKAMESQPPTIRDVPISSFSFHHYTLLHSVLLTVALPLAKPDNSIILD